MREVILRYVVRALNLFDGREYLVGELATGKPHYMSKETAEYTARCCFSDELLTVEEVELNPKEYEA